MTPSRTTCPPRAPRTIDSLHHELARTHRARTARRRAIAGSVIALPALALTLAILLPAPPPPSPLEGEGGSPLANREGGDSASLAHMTSPPPSPLEGEGAASRGGARRVGGNSLALVPAPAPSPLAGEGGSPLANREGGTSPLITIIHDTAPPTPMTDQELLAALAEAGHPSGLITIGGRTTVIANTSVDGDLSPFAAPFSAAP